MPGVQNRKQLFLRRSAEGYAEQGCQLSIEDEVQIEILNSQFTTEVNIQTIYRDDF